MSRIIDAMPWASTNRPIFLVWNPDNGGSEEDAQQVRARDAEDAAESWAEHDDRDGGDYTIVSGSPAIVHVKAPDGTVTKWRVTGESVPQYSAEEAP